MRISPDTISKARILRVPSAEEQIAYQLADIGLKLHKLGRVESYKQVIEARNNLLMLLDSEPLPQSRATPRRKSAAIADDQTVIACVRPKRPNLKAANHLR